MENKYRIKYLKYKAKYYDLLNKNLLNTNLLNKNLLNKNTQYGGTEKQTLKDVITKLNKKGYFYWLDPSGKILSKNADSNKAKQAILKKIKKNPTEWENKILINIKYALIPDDNKLLEANKIGPIEVIIELIKVDLHGKDIALARTNKNDLLRFYYFPDDIHRFKLNDVKKYAQWFAINDVDIDGLKYYKFKEVRKMLLSGLKNN